MIYYTYLIGWSVLNMRYYGMRGTELNPTDDLWHKYFTSSKYVSQYRKEHGEPDIIEIRQTFDDRLKAIEWEHKFLVKVCARKSSDWLNRSDGKYHGAPGPKNHGHKVSASLSGIKKSAEHRSNVSASLLGKYRHFTNGIENCFIKVSEIDLFLSTNAEFYPGRTFGDNIKHKMSVSRKIAIATGRATMPTYDKFGENNPMFGRQHSDSTKELIREKAKIRMQDHDNRMCGKKNGMFGKSHSEEFKLAHSKRIANKRWYTNEIVNIYINKDLDPPIGFRPGKKKSKRRTKAEMIAARNLSNED